MSAVKPMFAGMNDSMNDVNDPYNNEEVVYDPVVAHNYIVDFIRPYTDYDGLFIYTYIPECQRMSILYRQNNEEANTKMNELIDLVKNNFGKNVLMMSVDNGEWRKMYIEV